MPWWLWLWVLSALPLAAASMRRARKHERCLKSIDRLERELFPEYFPDPIKLKRDSARALYGYGPGVRWPVEQTNHIQVLNGLGLWNSAAKQEWLEDGFATEGRRR